jgi:hypothetical protein
MKVWITTIGSSPFAVINTLWAACELEDFKPERVYLIYNDKMLRELQTVKDWIGRITVEYAGARAELIERECSEEDFIRYSKLLNQIISEEKNRGNTVAVDITPGRKIMSAFSMHHGLEKADRVYYLHLLNQRYQNQSFMEIPAEEQNLIDMKKMVVKG